MAPTWEGDVAGLARSGAESGAGRGRVFLAVSDPARRDCGRLRHRHQSPIAGAGIAMTQVRVTGNQQARVFPVPRR
jgi:hypothetical protein